MNYSLIELEVNSSLTARKCHWCEKPLKLGERVTLIIPSKVYKESLRELENSVVIHSDKLQELIEQCNNNGVKLLEVLESKDERKLAGNSVERQHECDAFKNACINMGFTIDKSTNKEILMGRKNTTMILAYNPRNKQIKLKKKGNTRYVVGLIIRQIETTVYNDMHALLGDGIRKEVRTQYITQQGNQQMEA